MVENPSPDQAAGLSTRRILSGSLDDRHERSFTNQVIHITPANAISTESQQPDHERGRVPDDDEGHLLPKTALLESPDADQPGDQDPEDKVGAEIREADCGWMRDRNGEAPR